MNNRTRKLLRELRPVEMSAWGIVLSMLAGFILYRFFGLGPAAMTAFVILGVWGLHQLIQGNMHRWLGVVLFFGGADSIIRVGLPIGFQVFYYYLLGSFAVHAITNRLEADRGIRRILLGWCILLLLMLLNISDNFLHGYRTYVVIFAGVGAGIYLASRVDSSYAADLMIWFLMGSMWVSLNHVTDYRFGSIRFWPRFDGTGPVSAISGLGFLISIYYAATTRNMRDRTIMIVTALISLTSVIMTVSRGAAMAIFGSVGLWILLNRNARVSTRVIVSLGLIVAFVAATNLDDTMGGGLARRFTTEMERYREGTSREGRLVIFGEVAHMLGVKPVLGAGTGGWGLDQRANITPHVRVIFSDTHSIFLQFLYEAGIVGLLIFLYTIFRVYGYGARKEAVTGIPFNILLLYFLILANTTYPNKAALWVPFLFLCTRHAQSTLMKVPKGRPRLWRA